ncbi:MAG: TetR family transcriptional regulator [Gammaproteobacteria bacterium]|nr:TetR family transcriptional regulator [Gammaproteobacteria bacterium]
MARTQAADYDERRDAIVAKAAELYGQFGFLGSSIADLAAACGMSKSLLYHYFSSKQDILFEIMDGHVTALGRIAAGVRDEADPKQRLFRLTQGFMALYVPASSRHKVLLNDLDKLPPHRRKTIITDQRVLLDALDQILVELSPTLAKKPRERRAATMIYFGMINWTHTWFDPKGALGAADIAELAVDIFVQGVLHL